MLANLVQLRGGRVSSLSSSSGDALRPAVQSERLCNRALCFANAYVQANCVEGSRVW